MAQPVERAVGPRCSSPHTSLFLFYNATVTDEENKVSVMEGDRAKLNTDVSELQRDALILWMFGSRDGLIAKADMENNRISIYDGADGRYRDRLELDRQTGSLSITNTTCTDSGLYKLKIISSTETKSKLFRVTVSGEELRFVIIII